MKAIMLITVAALTAEWTKFKTWCIKKYMPATMRFLSDRRASASATGKIVEWIGLVIALIFGIYMLPIVVDAIVGTNFTNWTFTGAAGAKVLYQLTPFVFIVGMIVYFVLRLIGKI